jgi:hypothetical protein
MERTVQHQSIKPEQIKMNPLKGSGEMSCYTNRGTVKADSHIACRAHAAPLPCSNSAVSFVKLRVVAGNIRTASPTV